MNDHVFNDSERSKAMMNRGPLRHSSRPDDVAGAAIFMASRAGSFLTGAVLPESAGCEL